MSATLREAVQRILTEFLAQWGGATPVAFDNESVPASVTDGGVSWVRVSVIHDTRTQSSMGPAGARKFRTTGRVIVQVFTPLDKGRAAGDTLVESIISIFEGKTIGPESIYFFGAQPTEIGRSDSWYQTNVEASFSYQESK